MSIKSEILGIAADHGYEGTAQTITGAINALTDTLAGEDVAGGRTVASAIHALGPYIGGGGSDADGFTVGYPCKIYAYVEGGSDILGYCLGSITAGETTYPLTSYQLSSNNIFPPYMPSGLDVMVLIGNVTVKSVTLRCSLGSSIGGDPTWTLDYEIIGDGDSRMVQFTIPQIKEQSEDNPYPPLLNGRPCYSVYIACQ